MRYRFAPVTDRAARAGLFARMVDEGLVGCAMSALAAPTLEQWLAITAPDKGVLLAAFACGADGPALACALFSPRRGRVWEFDFTTFRAGARQAVPMAHGALAWVFAHLPCAAVLGLCPAPNRHAWRLAPSCGFAVLGRLPEACWHARKGRHVDGMLVLATPKSLAAAQDARKRGARNRTTKEVPMGFGGGWGGGSTTPYIPPVTEAPKPEVAKPITEAATAARQSQKEKAAKAAGISGSIFTSPLNRADTARKTLLGQ